MWSRFFIIIVRVRHIHVADRQQQQLRSSILADDGIILYILFNHRTSTYTDNFAWVPKNVARPQLVKPAPGIRCAESTILVGFASDGTHTQSAIHGVHKLCAQIPEKRGQSQRTTGGCSCVCVCVCGSFLPRRDSFGLDFASDAGKCAPDAGLRYLLDVHVCVGPSYLYLFAQTTQHSIQFWTSFGVARSARMALWQFALKA